MCVVYEYNTPRVTTLPYFPLIKIIVYTHTFTPVCIPTDADDVGAQEMDQPTTESFTELEEVAEEQEMSPAGNKHDHIVDGEDMVVLDDASEAERTETLDIDHQISTTSEDVLGGIGGEGAELHPEYDDFDVDDQHFEVLETADGDFSGESHDLEQSPNLDDSLSEKKERERESGKRERSSYEKSGSYSLHCH